MSPKGFIKVALVIGLGVWFYASGNFQKTLDHFSDEDTEIGDSDSSTDNVNFEKEVLLSLIDDQSQLADEIIEARRSNSPNDLKRLFTEFEKLEADYQEQFNQAQSNLSTAEANEVSREHRAVTRKLN